MSAEPTTVLDAMNWGDAPEETPPEPESEQEPKAEPAEEQKAQEPTDNKADQLQAALHEARQQAKEAREAGDRLKQEMEQREQRMAEYVRQALEKKSEPEPDKPPSIDDDPVAHLRWQNEQLQSRLSQLEQGNQANAQQNEAERRFNALAQQITAQEQAFMREHPDYYQAAQHVKDHGAMLLEAQGYSPEQIPQQLQQWGSGFGYMHIQAGRNAAEQYYELAKKLGYKAPEAESADKAASDNLERIAAGQKQAGLGSGGGAVSAEGPSQDDQFPILTQAMRELGLV